jgi:hypothetical protein
VTEEADQIADSLRQEAGENRRGNVIEGDGALEGSEMGAVSSQPVGDLLEMLVRYHVEPAGGEFHRKSGGAGPVTVRWPGSEATELIRFPGGRDDDEGELITLDHPRIRGLLSRLPVHGKGEPIAQLRSPGLTKAVDGFWSLWVLRLTSFDFRRARVFPVYLSRDGRPFAQTARYVWDRLASLEFSDAGWITSTEAMVVHDQLYQAAAEDGRSHWADMERQHRQRWEEEKARAQYHFSARRRMLDQVGLAEVRGYRLRQLEAEETSRMAQIESQRSLLPDLEALTILSIEPA